MPRLLGEGSVPYAIPPQSKRQGLKSPYRKKCFNNVETLRHPNLPGRPAQRPSAEQVDVEMED